MVGEIYLLFGPTGAGKSVQAERLSQHLKGVHLSTGQLLRDRADDKTQAVMAAGQLAPTEIVNALLAEAMEEVPLDQPIVLDGFPRLPAETEWLDDYLDSHSRNIKAAVLLEVSREETEKRIMARGRSDDSDQSFQEKWQEYEELTVQVIERYEAEGLLIRVDGTGSIEAITERICEKL